MQILRRKAYARAGLLGNPSDGYGGKTISVLVRDFAAEVVLYEWDAVEIVQTEFDQTRFRSVQELARDVKLHGYYGGMRLLKAAIKKFVDYCERRRIVLHKRNFSIRYQSTIPRQVGLAGSSAIIVAALRCLMDFYGVSIPLHAQPSFVLSVETEELGIAAGLQDRVIQVLEEPTYMDFSPAASRQIDGFVCGRYETFDKALLPPLYVAYGVDLSEPTEVFHNDLRGRFSRGEPEILAAMRRFAELAEQGRAALRQGDAETFGKLMNANFDTRRSICRLLPAHVAMVETARSTGATAKFAGSGGAIVGTYRDEAMYAALAAALAKLGCRVLKPTL